MDDPSPPLPTWRVILNWGVVVYFLALPAMAIFYGMTHFQFATEDSQIAKFLADFHFTVSALVAAIAGLNTFERSRPAATNGHSKTEQRKLVS